MTSSLPTANLNQDKISESTTALGRQLFLVLGAIALFYAFCAGLRTVQDFDLGWQMATARWIVQHHQIPSFDVLSYTVSGKPWRYPVGSGLFFYAAYRLGGFALISCIGASACVGTVALLLRRGRAATATIAVLAVPLISARTTPRADMFTIVLFAAYLSLLWENYQTGRARLWLLPLLMVCWVNLHFGFASGLALELAYIAAELLECVFGAERRRMATQRLRKGWIWLACTVPATLISPFGWHTYQAIAVQQKANAQQQLWINEWAPVPIHWETIGRSLLVRQPDGAIYLLLAVALVAGAFALLRGQWAVAILLLGSTYPAAQAVRMGAVFACIVVVVGGWQWGEMLDEAATYITLPGVLTAVRYAIVACLAALAALRCFDLVTNRYYQSVGDEEAFGAGLCSWFPQSAAEFARRENLPPEIFNTYAAGGYLTWSLGPERRIYIDGRDTLYGPDRLARHSQLLFSSPDSREWQEEAARYNINTVVVALARYDGLPPTLLRDLCNSTNWRPVYLDERAAVFVRQSPENVALIQRLGLNCATTSVAVSSGENRNAAFNDWANAGITLAALERYSEAQVAYQRALSINSNAGFLHRYYGDLLFAMGRLDASEQEYLTALALDPSDDTWAALSRSYMKRSRLLSAADAMEHQADFSPRPYLVLNDLGYLYLELNQPENAVKAFDRAARTTPSALKAADNGFFEFKVAQGRSAAWSALGDLKKATIYQEEAANLQPNVPQPWRRLARMYEEQGRIAEAQRARSHAAQVEQLQTQH